MTKKQINSASDEQAQPSRPAKADAPDKQKPLEVVAELRRNIPKVPVRKPLFRN